MPDEPHEYTVRGETPDEQFEWFVVYIRAHGYRAHLDVGPWRYWTIGEPVDATTIINRAKVTEPPTVLLRR